MSAETEAIAAELGGVLEVLDRARGQVESTAEYTGSVTAQAAATGMAGVATALTAVREQIKAMNTGIDAGIGSGREARSAVESVKGPAQTDEAKAHLSTAAEKVDAARGALVGVAQQIATIKARVEVILRGAQPGPLLGRLDSLRQYLVAAVGRLDAAKAKITTTAAQSGQTGNR